MAFIKVFSVFACLVFFAGIAQSLPNPQEDEIVRILEEPEKVQLYPNPSVAKRVPPRCGDVHINNASGIYYKAFEAVLENERCAWIIAVPNAIGYTIDIQYLGNPTNSPGSGQELLLTGVRHQHGGSPSPSTPYPTGPTPTGWSTEPTRTWPPSEPPTPTGWTWPPSEPPTPTGWTWPPSEPPTPTGWTWPPTSPGPTSTAWPTSPHPSTPYPTWPPTWPTSSEWPALQSSGATGSTSYPPWPVGPIMTTYQPRTTGAFNVSDANIIIITFHSSSVIGESTGFALQYHAIHGNANIGPTSPLSTQHIMESPTLDFHYPRTGSTYDDYELAAFVFPPGNNIYSGIPKHIWYKRDQLESCYDALYVYTFNANLTSSSGKWQQNGQICDTELSQYISSEEMNLILFQSDSSVTRRGFSLNFFTC